MKIGFIKFGLTTKFEKEAKSQGSNHELVDVFNIFKERGHECVMISGSDKYGKGNPELIDEVDVVFAFNGPFPRKSQKLESVMKAVMLARYTMPYALKLKSSKTPYIYFWTDARPEYRIWEAPQFIKEPHNVLSQEPTYYAHLEKLICYHNPPIRKNNREKDVVVVMNDTAAKRSTKMLNILKWVSDFHKVDVIGNWKKDCPYLKTSLNDNEVLDYISDYKYSIIIAKDPTWITQKFYEMAIAGVVTFYGDFDSYNLVLGEDSPLRFKDEYDLEEKISKFKSDNKLYERHLEDTQDLIKNEYINGDFMYKIIMSKIATLKLN